MQCCRPRRESELCAALVLTNVICSIRWATCSLDLHAHEYWHSKLLYTFGDLSRQRAWLRQDLLKLKALPPRTTDYTTSTMFAGATTLLVSSPPSRTHGASLVSLHMPWLALTPEPQQAEAPPGLPEQPLPPHEPQLNGQQTTSLALMPGMPPGHVSPPVSARRRREGEPKRCAGMCARRVSFNAAINGRWRSERGTGTRD